MLESITEVQPQYEEGSQFYLYGKSPYNNCIVIFSFLGNYIL
jgi:hypothetical protein